MIKVYSIIIAIFLIPTPIFPQFGSVKIDFDDRLLRSDERHDLINLKEDVKQFYLNTSWDKEYDDLNVPHISNLFSKVRHQKEMLKLICVRHCFQTVVT